VRTRRGETFRDLEDKVPSHREEGRPGLSKERNAGGVKKIRDTESWDVRKASQRIAVTQNSPE